jgi:hypothetical protein
MYILGKTMASHFFGRGGGRRGGLSPRSLGIHSTHGVINLPNGDRCQGSAPNIVIFFPSVNQNFITRIIISFHNMQIINHIKWFRHVLNNIGGTPPVLQCAIVGPNNTIQLKNLF